MLTATNISYRYGATVVLDNISLTIGDGEIVCLLGPSGCGKTTLINLLAGVLPMQEGRLDSSTQRPGPQLGHMTQTCDLLPWMTAQENVSLGARLQPQIEKIDKESLYGLFAAFGLSGYENAFPDQLSGGQKQRLVLIRTLVSKPSLLLLDEPLGQVDTTGRLNITRIVRDYVLHTKASALVATHQLDVAVALADTILLLDASPARIVRTYSLANAHLRKQTLDTLSHDLMESFFPVPEEAA